MLLMDLPVLHVLSLPICLIKYSSLYVLFTEANKTIYLFCMYYMHY